MTESAAEHTRVETVLPVEWEKSFSEEEGRNYYYNRKSGVTQWELPEGGQKGGSLIKMCKIVYTYKKIIQQIF